MSLYQLILACSILGVGVFPIPIPQFYGQFIPLPPDFNPFQSSGFLNPAAQAPQVSHFHQIFYPDEHGDTGDFDPAKDVLKSLRPPAVTPFHVINGYFSASNGYY